MQRRYFGTDGIRGEANVHPLTPEFIVRLGQAAAEAFLEKRGDSREWPSVVIGRDTRQSGDMLESAIAAGLNSRGIDVRLAGVIPTPAVALLTRDTGAAFGIVISASHNPFGDNGIKFFGPDGFKLDDEFELEIERRLELEPSDKKWSIGRTSEIKDATERYVAFVRESAGHDPDLLDGMVIALDAANGAAYQSSESVLRSLGAEVKVSHNRPSGININEDCGCTHARVIEQLVKDAGAHVGVSHDGDADRVLLCDETGSVLDGDELMAIAAQAMIEDGTLKDNTLVATVMSNAGLEEAINSFGGKVERTGVGDRYVLEAMKANGWNLGGEQSGHFIFMDHNTTGDGIVAAVQLLKILRESGKPLSELRRIMTKFPQILKNVRVNRKVPIEELAAGELLHRIEEELGSAGRIMLRYSGTEPLLRILIEGKDADYIHEAAEKLAAAIIAEIGETAAA